MLGVKKLLTSAGFASPSSLPSNNNNNNTNNNNNNNEEDKEEDTPLPDLSIARKHKLDWSGKQAVPFLYLI